MSWELKTGDSLELMREMEDNTFDSVVCDPPYGYNIMDQDWDHGVPGVAYWEEALRVSKPGAILMAFGGTRMWHRLAVAIEDAGWIFRDTVMWVYASGWPKGLDIGKGIDAALGADRPVVGQRTNGNRGGGVETFDDDSYEWANSFDVTAPATEQAALWDGWNTTLSPAWEPVLIFMKPLDGTFAENALKHGVAGFWIDGCRIELVGIEDHKTPAKSGLGANGIYGKSTKEYVPSKDLGRYDSKGRWPTNFIHDGSDEVMELFPYRKSGKMKAGQKRKASKGDGGYGGGLPDEASANGTYGDEGSAARYFYCAKASRAEREAGLDDLDEVQENPYGDGREGVGKTGYYKKRRNTHKTVKPIDLMRYLVRLSKTPTGGKVLDPFCGSGTTGIACALEGREFVGCDIKQEHIDIAERRIAHWASKTRQLSLL